MVKPFRERMECLISALHWRHWKKKGFIPTAIFKFASRNMSKLRRQAYDLKKPFCMFWMSSKQVYKITKIVRAL